MESAIAKLALVARVFATALVFCPVTHAATNYKVVHYFTGADGEGPYSGVIVDQKANLHGTTVGGGTGGCCGTVFELTPQPGGKWSVSVLHSFENNDSDGTAPYGGLRLDSRGNLYGTTEGGGGPYKIGTIFELTPHSDGSWAESILHRFIRGSGVGAPLAGLTMDTAGNLYGVGGSAFELSHNLDGWKLTVLHRFCSWSNCRDGNGPFAGLIIDASANLYGTTEGGGAGCDGEGCGTVYELTPSADGGWKERVLHAFDNNGKDGVTPGNGALMMDSSGNLYGTTESGGCCGGTVFKLTPGTDGHWKESILHNFKPGANGSFPTAGVVMDKAGNLYGTTVDGGTSCDCGVVYKLTPGSNRKWTYTVLHAFSGGDGAIPAGNLILDDKGNLYGGTVLGGGDNDGVIFELTP